MRACAKYLPWLAAYGGIFAKMFIGKMGAAGRRHISSAVHGTTSAPEKEKCDFDRVWVTSSREARAHPLDSLNPTRQNTIYPNLFPGLLNYCGNNFSLRFFLSFSYIGKHPGIGTLCACAEGNDVDFPSKQANFTPTEMTNACPSETSWTSRSQFHLILCQRRSVLKRGSSYYCLFFWFFKSFLRKIYLTHLIIFLDTKLACFMGRYHFFIFYFDHIPGVPTFSKNVGIPSKHISFWED